MGGFGVRFLCLVDVGMALETEGLQVGLAECEVYALLFVTARLHRAEVMDAAGGTDVALTVTFFTETMRRQPFGAKSVPLA